MEVYLNIVEVGDGLYGVETAGKVYFGKPAAQLSREQSALIIACFPSPLRWSPHKPGKFVRKKQDWIIRQMTYTDGPEFLNKKQ
jgi:monofunctional biosynthetic peptidoglycan transglycosylase